MNERVLLTHVEKQEFRVSWTTDGYFHDIMVFQPYNGTLLITMRGCGSSINQAIANGLNYLTTMQRNAIPETIYLALFYFSQEMH